VKMHTHSEKYVVPEKDSRFMNDNNNNNNNNNNRVAVQREREGAMYDSQIPNHKTQIGNNFSEKTTWSRGSVRRFEAQDDEVLDKFTSPVRRRLSFDDMDA
jgi:hypothetical protein